MPQMPDGSSAKIYGMRSTPRVAAALLLTTLAACGESGQADDTTTTSQTMFDPATEVTAYIAEVVADPPGDDLATEGGEHVVIRNEATIRIDMGGWTLDVDGEHLPLGVGRQIEVGGELRVHTGPGTTDDDDVFVGLDHEVLPRSGIVTLRDSMGVEVTSFAYGP